MTSRAAFGDLGTWDFGPTAPATTSLHGTGCPGSAGMPSLSPRPWAGPWLGDRFECDLTNRPPGLGIFVWGFSDSNWQGIPLPWSLAAFGSPNCFLRASDDIHEILLPGITTYTSFVLPNHPSFLGAVMFGQAGFFDAANNGAIVTSNALTMTFGSK